METIRTEVKMGNWQLMFIMFAVILYISEASSEVTARLAWPPITSCEKISEIMCTYLLKVCLSAYGQMN